MWMRVRRGVRRRNSGWRDSIESSNRRRRSQPCCSDGPAKAGHYTLTLRRRGLFGWLLRGARRLTSGFGDLHCFRGRLALLRGLQAELLREALNAPFRVDQLLTSGEERMAVGADFEVKLWFRRARLEGVAARATSLDLFVVRVNPFLHCLLLRGW